LVLASRSVPELGPSARNAEQFVDELLQNLAFFEHQLRDFIRSLSWCAEKHCRVPKGRPEGFPCSSPESSATSADLDRRIDGKLQVEDKASRFKSYHAADKCYERWRALRTSPDGRAELLEFFVFSVCYECYAHSLRALLAVRTPLFRFGLPAHAACGAHASPSGKAPRSVALNDTEATASAAAASTPQVGAKRKGQGGPSR
jgi:hypothetical protein